MKLISEQKDRSGGATLVILPQDKEDLFTIYNIVNTGDEIIFKRNITNKEEGGSSKKTQTDLVKLHLKVVSNEFEPETEFLKYKGITVPDPDANRDIAVGRYFSYLVDFKFPFTVIKDDYNNFCKNALHEACDVSSRTDVGAVVLQEGIAHVCLLTPFSTSIKNKVEYSMPKKKRATDLKKYDEKTGKFYKNIIEAMIRHFNFDSLKVILLCSPGFWASTLLENLMKYAEQNKVSSILLNSKKIVVAHCSTGYLQGIDEVLKNPAYSNKLSEAKNSNEVQVMDEFLDHLNKDDFKAWYGTAEVFKAASLMAISTLLITDTLLRSDDVEERKKYLALVSDVEKQGGKVVVFSAMHSTGEEIDKLTGVACILSYPIADLDEDEEDEEDDEDN